MTQRFNVTLRQVLFFVMGLLSALVLAIAGNAAFSQPGMAFGASSASNGTSAADSALELSYDYSSLPELPHHEPNFY